MESCHNQRSDAPAASSASPTIDADLKAVTAALAGVEPRPGRVLLFSSRARGMSPAENALLLHQEDRSKH